MAIHGKKVHEVNTLASVNLPLMNVPPPARNNNFTTTVQQPAPSTPLAPRSNYANPTNSGTTLTSAPTTPQSSQPPPTTDLNPFPAPSTSRHPVINGNAMAVSTAPARSNTPAPPPEPIVPSRGDRPQMTLNEARQRMIDEELVATDARAVGLSVGQSEPERKKKKRSRVSADAKATETRARKHARMDYDDEAVEEEMDRRPKATPGKPKKPEKFTPVEETIGEAIEADPTIDNVPDKLIDSLTSGY
jgi:hypothetical protein